MDGIITVAGTLNGELSAQSALSGELNIGGAYAELANEDNVLLTTESGIHIIARDAVETASIEGELTTAEHIYVPTYSGNYTVTPTSQAQTIPIGGLVATQDITVNPIPSNYGLVTWDGSTLTVS